MRLSPWIPSRALRAVAAVLALAALLLSPAAARAGGTLDQTSPAGGASFNVGTSSLTWQQQIKAGLGGQLAGISVTIVGGAGSNMTLSIRKGAAWSSQPVLFQGTVTSASSATQQVFVDMTAANISLAAGDVFVMELNGNSGLNVIGTYVAPPGTPAYSQPLYLNSAVHSDGGWRIGFQTYVYTCTPGAACDDKNPCTTNDVCGSNGICAGTPVTCSPQDACHVAGTCDPSTGGCSNPPATDGTPCNDNDACTQTDTCQAGVCKGGSPITCSALDGCHDVGVCNPMTGTCTNPAKMDGAACSDDNACTQTDTCMAGVCSGANPVMCPPPDQCHDAGTCDPKTGMCTNAPKADGTPCDDGNACTQSDTCMAGACTPGAPVACSAMDQCHDVGLCDPTTGMCSNPNKMDGAACDDGDPCTQTDTCQSGACHGTAVTCTALDECHLAGTCDPQGGTCSNPSAPDGTPCKGGTCTAGVCKPTEGTGGAGTGGAENGGGETGGSGGSVTMKGGCGCGVAETGTGGAPALALLMLLAARRRSRRAA
jgi:MYXO-CTERM domain-containing protein